jgi:hypothetical protein
MSRHHLSNGDLLLLLGSCFSAERKCEERIEQAIRAFQGSRVSYLQQLRAHYAAQRREVLKELHARGITDEQINRKLQAADGRPSNEPC